MNGYHSRFGYEGTDSTESSILERSSHLETPLGDRDRREKVQLCIELREQTTKSKKKTFHLDVVVMHVKYLHPAKPGKLPVPIVKLRLRPGNEILHTDLKQNDKNDVYFYGEPLTFLVDKTSDLKGKFIEVTVCDKKVTRHAHCFGGVDIPLDDYEVGKPHVQWYYLDNNMHA